MSYDFSEVKDELRGFRKPDPDEVRRNYYETLEDTLGVMGQELNDLRRRVRELERGSIMAEQQEVVVIKGGNRTRWKIDEVRADGETHRTARRIHGQQVWQECHRCPRE